MSARPVVMDRSRGQHATSAFVTLNPGSTVPIKSQIEACLRAAIVERRLGTGIRLPSTRHLASDLGVARNTVAAAYDDLMGQGLIVSRGGSGTYVASTPTAVPAPARGPQLDAVAASPDAIPHLSTRGKSWRGLEVTVVSQLGPPGAFRPGVPFIDPLSVKQWMKEATSTWGHEDHRSQLYGDVAGLYALRKAIAEHLGAHRGIRCDPDQVVVVSGSQQGLDLAFRAIADPGDSVIVSDPTRTGVRSALLSANLTPSWTSWARIPTAALAPTQGRVRAICVSPTGQFPLVESLSCEERSRLLGSAAQAGLWVVEDDFDGDFRYSGQPCLPLQAVDRDGRVIYVGSFSRSLFPSIRLGFLVVPDAAVDAVVGLRSAADRQSSTWLQGTLARFIAEGQFSRHLSRANRRYAERQHLLVEAISRHGEGDLEAHAVESGMHLVAWLHRADGRSAEDRARWAGVESVALSRYTIQRPLRQALLLGFSTASEPEIERAVVTLVDAVRSAN